MTINSQISQNDNVGIFFCKIYQSQINQISLCNKSLNDIWLLSHNKKTIDHRLTIRLLCNQPQ